MDGLAERRVDNAVVIVCGESNIVSLVRASREFYDPFGFADALSKLDVSIILNPIHDYMRRCEMRKKRRYFSRGDRTVLSVWNRGKGREPDLPWTVYHDDIDRTQTVRELPELFVDRPDIRVGVVDVAML